MRSSFYSWRRIYHANIAERSSRDLVLRPAANSYHPGHTELKPTGLLMFEGDGEAARALSGKKPAAVM